MNSKKAENLLQLFETGAVATKQNLIHIIGAEHWQKYSSISEMTRVFDILLNNKYIKKIRINDTTGRNEKSELIREQFYSLAGDNKHSISGLEIKHDHMLADWIVYLFYKIALPNDWDYALVIDGQHDQKYYYDEDGEGVEHETEIFDYSSEIYKLLLGCCGNDLTYIPRIDKTIGMAYHS